MYTLEHTGAEPVVIGGEEIDVGELSVDQTILISRIVYRRVKALRNDPETSDLLQSLGIVRNGKVQGLDADGPPSDDEDAPMVAPPTGYQQIDRWLSVLMAMLEPEDVAAMESVILDRDAEWCRKHVKLRHLPQIITALREHNDPGELMLAFRQAVQGWRPLSNGTSSAQPS